MIIDSKVSLTDYERLVNADDDDKERYLKAHVNSIKKHVDQLSDKNYQDLYDIESPDFVLMFIPIEPAFAVAVNDDNSLYNKAFEKNIVIVTPSTLLATLRTIDTMWNNEKQQRNAIEIARQAGALYDKFEGLVSDLTGVGKKIDAAKTDYSAAMNKLVDGRGNLITSVEKLKKLGAKAKKSLPETILKRAQDNPLSEGAINFIWAYKSSAGYNFSSHGNNRGSVAAGFVLGVEDFNTQFDFLISPNPVASVFDIDLPDGITRATVDIY